MCIVKGTLAIVLEVYTKFAQIRFPLLSFEAVNSLSGMLLNYVLYVSNKYYGTLHNVSFRKMPCVISIQVL